jgi:hypothetical protein
LKREKGYGPYRSGVSDGEMPQSLLMSRLVNEKFIVTYVESGKSENKQVRGEEGRGR